MTTRLSYAILNVFWILILAKESVMNFKVLATGSGIPKKIVANDYLEKLVETSDEWITQRVGVKERHICATESLADVAAAAAKNALEQAGVDAKEVDLIIASTVCPERMCPTLAGDVQRKIGATCPAFDINSACSGFIFALETAAAFFSKGGYKKILVIAGEKISRYLDWSDRNTCVIFGDGAGAFLLGEGDGLINSKLYTAGEDEIIEIPTKPVKTPFYDEAHPHPFIKMNGQETFKFAVKTMTEDVLNVVSEAGYNINDIKYIIPHQANIRIIQLAAKKLKLPLERFFVNLEKYGNTSSASIPIAADELNRSGKLKEGDLVVLTAFGGGLSSGVCLLRW